MVFGTADAGLWVGVWRARRGCAAMSSTKLGRPEHKSDSGWLQGNTWIKCFPITSLGSLHPWHQTFCRVVWGTRVPHDFPEATHHPWDDICLATTPLPAICHCLFTPNSTTTKMCNSHLLPRGAGARDTAQVSGARLLYEHRQQGCYPRAVVEAGRRGTRAKAHTWHKSKLVHASHGQAQSGNQNHQRSWVSKQPCNEAWNAAALPGFQKGCDPCETSLRQQGTGAGGPRVPF